MEIKLSDYSKLIILMGFVFPLTSCNKQLIVSDIVNWIKDDNVTENIVTKIIREHGTDGGPMDSFKYIDYFENRENISNCYQLLSAKVTEIDEYYIWGDYEDYTFYYNGMSNRIRIMFGTIRLNDHTYKLDENYKNMITPPSKSVICFARNSYNEVYTIDNEEIGTIDYLGELEFQELDNKPEELAAPVYYLSKLANKLEIYNSKIFSYHEQFYNIVGEKDFSDLFANKFK